MAITKRFSEQTPMSAGLAGDEALECLCGGRPSYFSWSTGIVADSQETEAWHSTAKRHYLMDSWYFLHTLMNFGRTAEMGDLI
jgi:hypothetical protein